VRSWGHFLFWFLKEFDYQIVSNLHYYNNVLSAGPVLLQNPVKTNKTAKYEFILRYNVAMIKQLLLQEAADVRVVAVG